MSLAAPPVLEPPPPDARLFTAAGGNLLVRAPPGLPDTALSPPAPGGTVPLEGGASRAVEFETDLFKGRFKVRGRAGRGAGLEARERGLPITLGRLGGRGSA